MPIVNMQSPAGGHNDSVNAARDYARIARAIEFIAENAARQPSLDEIAATVNTSPYHFQRLFTRWSGISPKRFLGYLTLDYAKRALAAHASVLDAALDAGLSGPSRLHDLFVSLEAVTPGEFKARGDGLTIRYSIHDGPFGRFIVGMTERGVCALEFDEAATVATAEACLGKRWPLAHLAHDHAGTLEIASRLFSAGSGLRLWCQGSNFQVKVWTALLRVPPGGLVSYRQLAAAIGQPTASRAVGNALASNPIAVLIPCHRVIRGTGLFDDYKWGAARKRVLIAWEAARADESGAGDERAVERLSGNRRG
jgi:AraC family transcriptional regulator of adaptative response/methylated-DNA-[protein]-cysteine methyltransferase